MTRFWFSLAVTGVALLGCNEEGGRGGAETEPSTSGTAGDTESTGSSATADSRPTSGSDPTTDPSSDSDSDSASSTDATTGGTGGPECGDGDIDPGEDCDDGNDVPSDGCNNDCVESGSIIWTHTHASAFGEADENWGVAADDDSNAYVAGFTQAAVGDPEIFLRGYSRPGGLMWTRVVGQGVGVDQGFGVAHSGGSLYFVGTIFGGPGGTDIWFARYDLAGASTWALSATGNPVNGQGDPIPGNDGGWDVAVGPDGNPVLAGYLVATDQGQNAWARKIDPNGTELWSQTYTGSSDGNDQVMGVAVDSANNVILVGFERNDTRDMFVRKVDPAGTEVWVRSIDGTDMLSDRGNGVVVTDDDQIVISGQVETAASADIFFLRRYDADGVEVWTQTDQGSLDEGAQARRMALAPNGDFVVAGNERDTEWKAIVRRYSGSGDLKWEQRFDGAAMTESFALDITVAPDNTIHVSGIQDLGVDARDAWVARLAP